MHRTSFDRYEDRYAVRARGIRSSAMRDLMAITQRPEVISLAGGLPDTGAFDPELLAEITAAVSRETHAAALQYAPTDGLAGTKDVIGEVMRVQGMHVEPAHIIVTTGGQQVLDLVARTFVDPGDVVLAEGPTYPGAVPVFSSVQAEVRHIMLDEDGLPPDGLRAALAQLAAEGRRAKYLYTIPTFHNPAGVTMSVERRREIVAICAEHDLLILEDDPYAMLRYEGEPVPTLRSLDEHGIVMYTSTFSKIFAPGTRLGWIEAPAPILAKINLAKQAADLCSSSLSQLVVQRFFLEHDWMHWVEQLRAHYRLRRNVLLRALAEHFPNDATWTTPRGGLFVWATLPSWLDTQDLLARALRSDVAFVPGAAAFLDGQGASSMRLNFSAVSEDRIEEGVRRIGVVIDEATALAESLGVDITEDSSRVRARENTEGDA